MFKPGYRLYKIPLIRTYSRQLRISRPFTKSSIVLKNETDISSSVIKPKSHRSKTLEELLIHSKEKKLQSETKEPKAVEIEASKSKLKALDMVNTGPKIAPNWRKLDIPEWQRQRFALLEKFSGEAWSPKKKISREEMKSVRILKEKLPDMTTKELSEHFRISPEAIRRILKSKWTPTEKEEDSIHDRWKKRGIRVKEILRGPDRSDFKTPKVLITSLDDYTKVKYSKFGNFEQKEKVLKNGDSKKRLHTRDSKGLRKMKF